MYKMSVTVAKVFTFSLRGDEAIPDGIELPTTLRERNQSIFTSRVESEGKYQRLF